MKLMKYLLLHIQLMHYKGGVYNLYICSCPAVGVASVLQLVSWTGLAGYQLTN